MSVAVISASPSVRYTLSGHSTGDHNANRSDNATLWWAMQGEHS